MSATPSMNAPTMHCDAEELHRLLEEVMGPPPQPHAPPRVGIRPLDSILGSRTHVRVVRELVAAEGKPTAVREIARRAVASHGRVLQVLRQMASVGFTSAQRTPTHVIYRLRDDHPLATAVRCLFEREKASPS
jgi:hypothetical protein